MFASIHTKFLNVSRVAVWVGGAALMLSAIMVTLDVISRKIFGYTISGSDETYNVDIWGTRDGNVISFNMGAHVVNDFQSTSGKWVISADGARLEGSWVIPGKNSQGQWNLERVK